MVKEEDNGKEDKVKQGEKERLKEEEKEMVKVYVG